MILPPHDAKAFFQLCQKLDTYFNSRLNLLNDNTPQDIHQLRLAAYADPSLIKNYVNGNPDHLSDEDLETVQAWQDHGIYARFLIVMLKKDQCVFQNTVKGQETLYLVQGLTQPITELLPFVPCYAQARLLPFRGRIVSDGLIAPVMMHFSSRVVKSFMTGIREQAVCQGIATSLPAVLQAPSDSNTALLSHYLSTAANREHYQDEILGLTAKSPALLIQYLQQMGKVHSRRLKASLKANGISTGWFAILKDTIIAGADNKNTAAACAGSLLPAGMLPALVWLKLG